MIVVRGRIKAKPEHFERVKEVSLEQVCRSRTEDGCISHEVTIDCEDANMFVFFERWRDQAALQTHFEHPGSKAFIDALRGIVAEPPELNIYPVIETPAA